MSDKEREKEWLRDRLEWNTRKLSSGRYEHMRRQLEEYGRSMKERLEELER